MKEREVYRGMEEGKMLNSMKTEGGQRSKINEEGISPNRHLRIFYPTSFAIPPIRS